AGDVVAYYLPGALTAPRQVSVLPPSASLTLAPTLRENWLRGGGKGNDGAWRNAERLFLSEHRGLSFGRGNVTASPAWHSQAQTLGPGPRGKRVSEGQAAFQQFIRDHLETGCLMSAALVLAHPEQYALTRACLEKQSGLRHVCNRIHEWAFGFNVLTIVSNRETLTHRDKLSGGLEWLDELVSIGGDDTTVLELPGVGVRFQYRSGTIVLFSGHTHLHGVSASKRERVCFAAYAR
ncbi:hypothetical protein PENSPDRAFT_548123, partial [Peniophora sp. CONT]